jgi:hypothetical protein
MVYKSADERFDMAEKAIEDLREIALVAQEIGSYSNQDEAAFRLLILNLANAMGILDPERSTAVLKKKAAEYDAEIDLDSEFSKEPVSLGQYL